MAAERESLQFGSREEFRDWMLQNQELEQGIWLIIAKKGAPFVTVTYAEALDVALEFGWIDGQSRGRDEHTSYRGFTPRRSASPWSMRNRTAAEAMIAEGRMSARGQAEIDRAKADGRWDRAYATASDAKPHPDFLAALAENDAAAAYAAEDALRQAQGPTRLERGRSPHSWSSSPGARSSSPERGFAREVAVRSLNPGRSLSLSRAFPELVESVP
jgi:uncharacterized protein YdeI (YjbR/CyaY-like superfamily)